MFKSKKKTMSEECWNLDYELIKWLNEHLKVYLKDASTTVDLEYWKFDYKDKNYTQKEIIEILIKDTDYMLVDWWEQCFSDSEKMENTKNEIYDLLKLVHFVMWW